MGFTDVISRAGRWVLRGIPENKIFVDFSRINYGGMLEGRTAVVTGGSSGIGYAIALKLAEEKAKVLLTGRNEEKLKSAVKRIRKINGQTDYYVCDVTDFSVLNRKIDDMAERLGAGINICIHSAGIWQTKNINTLSYAEWDNIMNTNLKSVYFFTQKVLDYMGRGDCMVVIGSENAGINDTNPYGILKSGLHHFIQGLAKERNEQGIRINGVAPGPTVSAINPRNPADGLQRGNNYRILRAEEVAEVVCFLVSSASVCINGQIIYCDEGDGLR